MDPDARSPDEHIRVPQFPNVPGRPHRLPPGRRRLVPHPFPRADARRRPAPGPSPRSTATRCSPRPTGSGKTLAAFLAAIDELVREGLATGLSDEVARALRLAAEGAVERHPQEPRGAARRHPRAAARAAARRRADPRRPCAPATPRPPSARACAARRRTSWSRRRSRSTSCSPRSPAARCSQTVRTRDRRRAARGGGQQARRAPDALARAAARRCAAGRPLRIGISATAEADGAHGALPARQPRGEACEIVDTGSRARARSRDRAAALAARAGHGQRGLGRDLRPARRAGARAPHDADLRQHAPARRARGAPPRRAARRRAVTAHHGSLAREHRLERRAAAEGRQAQGAGGHRLAGARHRHRRRRPRLPDRLAARDRDLPAAGRPLRPRRRRDAEGPAVPAVAGRPRRVRGAARRRAPRGAGSRSACRDAAGRARPADRRRSRLRANGAWTICSRLVRRAWPYRDLARGGIRRRSCRCSPTATRPGAAGARPTCTTTP